MKKYVVQGAAFGTAFAIVAACTSTEDEPTFSNTDASVTPIDGALGKDSTTITPPKADSSVARADAAATDAATTDAAATDAATTDAAATDAATTDAATTDAATTDAATTDAATDSGTDACADAKYEDGNYVWGIWTCTRTGGTTDVKAFAIGLGIASVDQTFTGTNGVVNSNYSGAPACSRSTTLTVAYPSCGTVTSTTSTNYTCSATCDPGKCTAGTQPGFVDTYALSRSGSTFTTTRVLDAAFIAQTTLQKTAGCLEGDTETATLIKQ